MCEKLCLFYLMVVCDVVLYGLVIIVVVKVWLIKFKICKKYNYIFIIKNVVLILKRNVIFRWRFE